MKPMRCPVFQIITVYLMRSCPRADHAFQLKVHWHMHRFVQMQVVILRLCYVSKVSD